MDNALKSLLSKSFRVLHAFGRIGFNYFSDNLHSKHGLSSMIRKFKEDKTIFEEIAVQTIEKRAE